MPMNKKRKLSTHLKKDLGAVKKLRGPPAYVPLPNTILSENTLIEDDVSLTAATSFLADLDEHALSKSRKAIKQEWKKDKGKIQSQPSKTSRMLSAVSNHHTEPDEVDMDSDDLAFGSGASDDDDLSLMSDSSLDDLTNAYDEDSLFSSEEDTDELEQEFEQRQARRKSPPPAKPKRLPLKLPNGEVQHFDAASEDDSQKGKLTKRRKVVMEQEDDSVDPPPVAQVEPTRPNPLGTRFGRLGVRGILELPSKLERLNAARQEMASLSGDIMGDPENNLNLIKRLLAFCGKTLPGNKHDDAPALTIDQPVRALALLSMLAVFLDIIPQYRIRELTAMEKGTKVTQTVARQRDYENGLIAAYKKYLEICEKEVESASPLKGVGLKCLCDLVKDKTSFNFSLNIMEVISKQIARLDWDETSQICLHTIIHIFQNDQSGSDSLHLLQLLSRTIKSRSFKIHPALLASFLHLPLASSLRGVRASGDRSTKEQPQTWIKNKKFDKKKKKDQPHLSKKARKAQNERKEIEKEFAEAELAVSSEEKQKEQTETLKILFALYFRILKLDRKTALLSPALEGLAAFAHLINVDFFKDLLDHLKGLLSGQDLHGLQLNTREKLLCISTAFQLLSGQGEALDFDLVDFVTYLYAILIPLSIDLKFEQRQTWEEDEQGHVFKTESLASSSITASEATLLFKAIESVFVTSKMRNPPSRMLTFSKRLLTCALQWSGDSALRAIDIVRKMLVKEPSLESMLFIEDSHFTGQHNPETDELHLVGAEATAYWELSLLQQTHYDGRVRDAAGNLSKYVRNR